MCFQHVDLGVILSILALRPGYFIPTSFVVFVFCRSS